MSDGDHFSTFQITPEDQQAFVSVSISYEEFKEGLFVCFRDNEAFPKQQKDPFVEGLGAVAVHDSQGVPLKFANQGTFWFFYVKDFFLQTFHGNLILFEN